MLCFGSGLKSIQESKTNNASSVVLEREYPDFQSNVCLKGALMLEIFKKHILMVAHMTLGVAWASQ